MRRRIHITREKITYFPPSFDFFPFSFKSVTSLTDEFKF